MMTLKRKISLEKEGSILAMNPPTRHYEFLGPPGALLNTLAVPAVAYALFFACNEENACRPRLDLDAVLDVVASLPSLWDTDAALIYLSWYAFCVLAWVILPGDWVDGTVLRDGSKKKYKINGTTFNYPCRPLTCLSAFSTFLLALGIVSGIVFNFGPQAFTILYEKWVGLLTASVLMAIAQAVYCYASSFRSGALLALGGNSGNLIYDVRITLESSPDSVLTSLFSSSSAANSTPPLVPSTSNPSMNSVQVSFSGSSSTSAWLANKLSAEAVSYRSQTPCGSSFASNSCMSQMVSTTSQRYSQPWTSPPMVLGSCSPSETSHGSHSHTPSKRGILPSIL